MKPPMPFDHHAAVAAIKAKVIEIAGRLGNDARALASDEVIPSTGFIDSAGLLDLIAWYEKHFGIVLRTEEITIDNLGTLEGMAAFAERKLGER